MPEHTDDVLAVLGDSHVLVHASLMRVCRSASAAIMLSQLVYWHTHRPTEDGWFRLSDTQLEDQTALTRKQILGARSRLVQLGLIETCRKGIPCRMYYRLLTAKIAEAVLSVVHAQERTTSCYQMEQPDVTKEDNCMLPNGTTLDKTISKTSSKTISSPPSANADGPPTGDTAEPPKGSERKRSKVFRAPTVAEALAYAREIDLPGDEAQKWHAYYEANGWRVGRNPNVEGGSRGGTKATRGPRRYPRPESPQEAYDYGESIGLPRRQVAMFLDYWESVGWKRGGKSPVVDWRATMRTWKHKWLSSNPQLACVKQIALELGDWLDGNLVEEIVFTDDTTGEREVFKRNKRLSEPASAVVERHGRDALLKARADGTLADLIAETLEAKRGHGQ